MKFFIIILFVALAYGLPKPQSDEDDEDDTRIIDGVRATQMIPHLVSIRKNGYSVCGGSILDENTILTAAHCLMDGIDASYLSIGVGSMELYEQTEYFVSSYILHNEFNRAVQLDYDVALIKLLKPIRLIPGLVEKVSLVTSCPYFPYGEECTVAGWGREKVNVQGPVDHLNEAKLRIIKKNDPGCKGYLDEGSLSDTMFCAASDAVFGHSCLGDSGGPLTYINGDNNDAVEQVGIVSWGAACMEGHASVYTNICKVKSWIEKNKGSAKNVHMMNAHINH